MAKYGSGLSTNDVCKLELEEMEEVLNKYNVTEEDKNNLMGMLEEAYFQLSQAYASARVLEKHVCKMDFQTYLKERMEEEQKHPFITREERENKDAE